MILVLDMWSIHLARLGPTHLTSVRTMNIGSIPLIAHGRRRKWPWNKLMKAGPPFREPLFSLKLPLRATPQVRRAAALVLSRAGELAWRHPRAATEHPRIVSLPRRVAPFLVEVRTSLAPVAKMPAFTLMAVLLEIP